MSTAVGRLAETAAAEFLVAKGCVVVAQNWRTRWCEIDIVATRAQAVYFVEVKYRASNTWGNGLDYITPQKLRQMHFAAEFWCAKHKFAGDYRLAAIALTGNPPRVLAAVNSIG
ncbi:MAG TPA: YraN family protein [Magnetospirillaceae bacterium]|nr:YraN family protein [Magnetospirillaceae bacterium]